MHLGAFAQILMTILQKYCYRQCKSRIADAGEKIQKICGSRFAFKHILPHKIPKKYTYRRAKMFKHIIEAKKLNPIFLAQF